MGQYAINAAAGTYAQLQQFGLVGGVSNTKIGITVQIGYNNNQNQIFTPENTETVVDFALQNSYISFLSYWELARDHPILPDFPQNGPDCFAYSNGILENSCVSQGNLEFLHRMNRFNSPAGL
ncbi:hypothetical protein HK103_003198, partial [Boothiomyces macroporosus]